MDGALALALVALIATALAVVGLRIGMLIAPRVERWVAPDGPDDPVAPADTTGDRAAPAGPEHEDTPRDDWR